MKAFIRKCIKWFNGSKRCLSILADLADIAKKTLLGVTIPLLIGQSFLDDQKVDSFTFKVSVFFVALVIVVVIDNIVKEKLQNLDK